MPWRRAISASCLFVTACLRLPASPPGEVSWWGFADPSDYSAQRALASRRDLDVVLTGWIVIDSASYRPVMPYDDTVTFNARLTRLAFVTTYQGGRHRPETIRGLATNSEALANGASSIVAAAVRGGYSGLIMDFAGMTARDLGALLAVTTAITDSAHAHNLRPVVISVPAADTSGYPGQLLASIADLVMVLSFDEHAPGTAPGSPASPAWYGQRLRARAAETGSNRIVAAIPVDGYRWMKNGDASRISFSELNRLLERTAARVERDPVTHTLHAFLDDTEAWVSDRELAVRLVRDGRRTGVSQFVLWRIGGEDPLMAAPLDSQTIRRSR